MLSILYMNYIINIFNINYYIYITMSNSDNKPDITDDISYKVLRK